MKDFYEAAIRTNEEISAKNKRWSDLAGYAKLILFVLFLTATYYTVTKPGNIVYPAAALILFLIQAAAWILHAHLNGMIDHAEGMIEINQRYIMRINGNWPEFTDIGEEFLDPEHNYSSDLDIVGRKSLFQFLNITHTWYGRQAFAEDLLHSHYSAEEIGRRQESIRELSENAGLMGELEYRFEQSQSSGDLSALVKTFHNPRAFISSRVMCLVLTYLPLLTIIIAGIAVIFRRETFYQPAIILLIIQTILWLVGSAATNNYLRGITSLAAKFRAYHDVIGLVIAADFKSDELRQIQTALGGSGISAVQAFRQLAKIAEKVSMRGNVFLYFTLNPLLLWDYECAIQFSAWKDSYGPYCEDWFKALGRLESMMCFAVLNRVCDHTCFPEFSASRNAVASQLGHPLIGNLERVTNELHLQDQILIISGSNMSGKTTYLRTVGVNIVLARAGAPVCAKSMCCCDLHLVTSMRVADDLNEGISTFYAELKRIKMILDSAKKNPNTLFMIDEIFRGTNSVDRLAGAKTVIAKLSQLGVMGMITTHDLELCELQQEVANVQNYSFAEHYEDGKIHFDYKMRAGKSKTTNAKHLMALVGILDNDH